jgi:uncharacterized glyoxalase superfamily protein PhnB
MDAGHFEIILYVKEQQQSTVFYASVLEKQPHLNVPGMTEFILAQNLKLGLMPEAGIAKILMDKTPHPASGNGIPRCELYMRVENVEDVFSRSISVGAREISAIAPRDWGDTVGYVSDPDGHILAFAEKAKKPRS